MLNSERWSCLACLWTDKERDDLTFVWHHLDGAVLTFVYLLVAILTNCQGWPDAGEGLRILRQDKTLVTLSNIPLRTQLDMVRNLHILAATRI